ncbi:hypothetical protein ATANTOWER_031933 [Ataeniobius toweri]|uniref:Uncharacterized protein n=1 Tax=Ataeniobius toweri TaxID=208326 RepID=A0ABU7B3M7_9TELE|nr:hypothetical protein [Ataeniobius toweri]
MLCLREKCICLSSGNEERSAETQAEASSAKANLIVLHWQKHAHEHTQTLTGFISKSECHHAVRCAYRNQNAGRQGPSTKSSLITRRLAHALRKQGATEERGCR